MHAEVIKLATRRSPLALAQARMTARLFADAGRVTELLELVTTGDRRTDWSLEKQGGKGLFTSELEAALLRKEATVAVHSAKDLPTDLGDSLVLAGCLPRADARDVLVRRGEIASPRLIATGSPRRRAQLKLLWPESLFTEIRGNVDTRLKKIAAGEADASVLAAAGLARLGICEWPGLVFEPFSIDAMVPAVGQAAIALQSRAEDAEWVGLLCDRQTTEAVRLERAALSLLGGGCHASVAVHVAGDSVRVFHESSGFWSSRFPDSDWGARESWLGERLKDLGLVPGAK